MLIIENLSIVIPILNENKNLINLTSRIHKNVKKINFEIIFVDDNSNDGSKTTLQKLKKKYKNLRYYIRKKNRDLSQSCFFGIKKSKYKNILIMDGDGQHDPKYINKMFNIYLKKKADFVIGVRNFNKLGKSLNLTRYLASKFLIFLFQILFSLKTSDPMSGFFIFKRNFFTRNKNFFFGKGYKILADFIYSTNKKLKIIDFKIIFLRRKKEKSKMSYKILMILVFFILKRSVYNFMN